ncbi:hypothetical protein KVG29_05245 [Caldicoprobacter algeriensis]|uniref:helix-turn-helix domain-containing protein n=1 Tax=Caldicoprobacter algeriensis TaxID=699281 RepID=UPI002079EBF0|nr:helix-turn-helix domain-containing protein [Caldicoprobacter algeriensis]MCM8900634.1 hypothetical protein [Caldicoprobacter algeriensis]
MSEKWLTTTEISQRWGIADSTIRRAIKEGRITSDECQKTGYGPYGGVWLVKESAIRRLYGRPKFTRADIDEIEAILGVKNLGIDYDDFESGDELADWLDGRQFPEFDEPMKVTEQQRALLREIYKKL